MSKYIIELGEEANMVQVISVTQSGNAYIDSIVYVEYLEQLTADYINEHFGQLQDEAYQQGLEEGKKATFGLAADASNVEYQRGFEDGKAVNDKGCEGCMYQDKIIEHHPCGACCNAFPNQWTAKDTYYDIIRNSIHNWVTELNVKLEDISIVLEDMKHD